MSRIDEIIAKLKSRDPEQMGEAREEFNQMHPVAAKMMEITQGQAMRAFADLMEEGEMAATLQGQATVTMVSVIGRHFGVTDRSLTRFLNTGEKMDKIDLIGGVSVMLDRYYEERKRREEAPSA